MAALHCNECKTAAFGATSATLINHKKFAVLRVDALENAA
jgi:hypothetical protein